MNTILLTGATGLVGAEMLGPLAAGPERRIIALCRGRASRPPAECLYGDVRWPGLGLDSGTLAELQASVTTIVHCAADTSFGLPLDGAREVNTGGTAHLLRFAEGCGRLERLLHVSTVYVAGNRTGRIAEEFASTPARFFNAYQQSKYEAEELVREAAARLPVMVARLSSVAGDSASGRIAHFTYVHHLIRLLPRNVLEVAPADPEIPLDVIPTDYAAAALAWLAGEGFQAGEVVQVCAGPHESLPLREMLDLTLEAMGGPVCLPRFVSLEEYEEYAAHEMARAGALTSQVLTAVGYFLPHLALRQEFQNEKARAALAGSGLRLPPVRDYFPKVVNYCLANSRSSGERALARAARTFSAQSYS